MFLSCKPASATAWRARWIIASAKSMPMTMKVKLRAKRAKTVKEGMLIATVDIGATNNTGYCTTIDGRYIKVFKFGNTREEFDKFRSLVIASKSRFHCDEVIIGYESTGPHAEPLVRYLMDKPGHNVVFASIWPPCPSHAPETDKSSSGFMEASCLSSFFILLSALPW